MIDGVSYKIVTSEHMLEMQNLLRRSLDKPEVTELETNVVLYENILWGVYHKQLVLLQIKNNKANKNNKKWKLKS